MQKAIFSIIENNYDNLPTIHDRGFPTPEEALSVIFKLGERKANDLNQLNRRKGLEFRFDKNSKKVFCGENVITSYSLEKINFDY